MCHVIDKIILDHGQFLLPHDNHDRNNEHAHQTNNTKTRSDKHPSHIIIEKRILRVKHHTQVSIFRGLVIGEQFHVIESFCSLFLDILYDLLPSHNLPRERVINSRIDHFLFQVRIQINVLQAFLHLRHLRVFLPQITNHKLPYQIHHSLTFQRIGQSFGLRCRRTHHLIKDIIIPIRFQDIAGSHPSSWIHENPQHARDISSLPFSDFTFRKGKRKKRDLVITRVFIRQYRILSVIHRRNNFLHLCVAFFQIIKKTDIIGLLNQINSFP